MKINMKPGKLMLRGISEIARKAGGVVELEKQLSNNLTSAPVKPKLSKQRRQALKSVNAKRHKDSMETKQEAKEGKPLKKEKTFVHSRGKFYGKNLFAAAAMLLHGAYSTLPTSVYPAHLKELGVPAV